MKPSLMRQYWWSEYKLFSGTNSADRKGKTDWEDHGEKHGKIHISFVLGSFFNSLKIHIKKYF